MEKKGIILYRDMDGHRYAKQDNDKLLEVMESLLTIFDSYVKENTIMDYKSFFDNPLKYMTTKYDLLWNDYNGETNDYRIIKFLKDSGLRRDEVNGLKNRFDKLYNSLDEWNSAPIITKDLNKSTVPL